MPDLVFAAKPELDRVLALPIPPADRVRLFAACARLNTLYMIARAGSGHIGSSFSSLDIVSWLYLEEMRGVRADDAGADRDVFFSSKGHDVPGLYAVLLGLGLLPFDQVHELRRLGGLPGHPDVGTPGMATNTGPLGMGISKAKGMLRANRLAGRTGRFFVLTGDGELQEGQLWESLASAASAGMGGITAIVDHNKIQSDTWVRSTSDLGDLVRKFESFGWHAVRCDGHDLEALERTFTTLRAVGDRPKVIIADTVKGRGVSFMEHTSLGDGERFYRFHSGAPDDESYSRAAAELVGQIDGLLAAANAKPLATATRERPPRPAPRDPQRLVAAYSRALVAHAERDPRIVALDADLVLDTGLIPFAERFPDRFVECGIAEQDMVSQAGGLALGGALPVVHSFACFLSTRPNEQIYNNATERRKIVYVGSLAGLLPGGPGHSHQSVRDIAALGGTPGLEMLQPSCDAEVDLAVTYCLEESAGSCYLRLFSVPWTVPFTLPADYRLVRGRGVALTEGGAVVMFAYGPVMLGEAVRAAGVLRDRAGIGVRVVNLPWLNLVEEEWLAAAVEGARAVVTIDDHYVAGGQGEMLAASLVELGYHGRVVRLGVRDIPACGQNDEVLRAHRLDAEGISADVLTALGPGWGD
ncbi:MAG: transketolase [Gemmatimonadales bacterium]|nr:transketolase [Gemmatimonadales bacterium]